MAERKRNEQEPLNAEQRKKLRGFVEEIEKIEDEIDTLKLDLKGCYESAKTDGFDIAALKKVIADRKKDGAQLDLFEHTVAWYRAVVSQTDKPPRSVTIDRPFAPPLDA